MNNQESLDQYCPYCDRITMQLGDISGEHYRGHQLACIYCGYSTPVSDTEAGALMNYEFVTLGDRVLLDRIKKLESLINTPLVDNFIKALPLEAAHQQERWGTDHDAGKTPFDWVFLIGHLATRAATKLQEGNREKALHHTITTAAVCLNWHRHMQGELTRFRPGIKQTDGG